MFCTDDFEIVSVTESDFPSGGALVAVDVTPEQAEAFFSAYEYGITTRSRFARLFSDFRVIQDETPEYSDGKLTVPLLFYNFEIPIKYSVGDKVGRFYALNKEDLITGSELEELSKGIDGIVEGSHVNVDLDDYCYEIAKVDEPIPASEIVNGDKFQFLKKREHRSWRTLWDNMLLTTKRLNVPSGVYGLIRGTTWQGNTFHLNSTVINPGNDAPIILEIRARDDPAEIPNDGPKAIVEFYRET